MSDLELNPEPGSTVGASPEYKEAWWAKYGEPDEEPDEEPAPTPKKKAKKRGA